MYLILNKLKYILFIVLFSGTSPALAQVRSTDDWHNTQRYSSQLLKILLNDQDQNQITLVKIDKQKRAYVKSIDLAYWNLKKPQTPPIMIDGEQYYLLDQLIGTRYRLELDKMVLILQAHPLAFNNHNYRIPNHTLKPQLPDSPGTYLNYDINIPPTTKHVTANGLFDLGVFGIGGVMNNEFVVRTSVYGNEVKPQEPEFIRVNSVWQIDNPDKMQTLRLGDSITQPGMWGNAVSIGGIQFGTNFATQPRFLTYPLPTIQGEAILPSTVNLFINNALAYQQNITPGPFDIHSLPVINGSGDIQLVSRDLLGRQRIINIPYYASARLLNPQLEQYSVELGLIRNNYGLKSFDYGRLAAVATFRRGINNHFTRELHASITHDNQSVGLGGTYLFKKMGLIDGVIALSHSSHGIGSLAKLGLERISPSLNFGADVTVTTEKFLQLGQTTTHRPPKLQSTVYVGRPLKSQDNISLSLVSQVNRDTPSTHLLSASYSRVFYHDWSLILSGLTNVGGQRAQSVFLTLTHSMGAEDNASINGNSQNGQSQFGIQYNHNSAQINGLDYYLSALPGKNGSVQGGFNKTTEYGDVNVFAAYQNNETSSMVDISGGIIAMSGYTTLTRKITSSFGVVQVPGYSDLPIFLDNQLIAHTNKRGYAFIPSLRAYDDNKLQVHPEDLPMEANIEETEKHASPYYHSGMLIKFNIHQARNALVTVHLENGENVPAGAIAHLEKKTFPVADNGEVYLKDLKATNDVTVTWNKKKCHFKLIPPTQNKPFEKLGPLICQTK